MLFRSPLLSAPKPQIEVYGFAHPDLTFFGTPITESYRPKTVNTRLAMLTVTGGEMTIPQITRQLIRLVPVDQYQWDIQQVGHNVYKVMFPSKAELDRLQTFGTFKVPNSTFEITVDTWLTKSTPMLLLPQTWVRMKGIPQQHKGDFLALWALGTLFGKTFKVDMPFTRKHCVLRILIGCIDQTKIPKDLPVFIKDGFYNLSFEVEEPVFDLGGDDMDHDLDDLDDDPKKSKEQEKGVDKNPGQPTGQPDANKSGSPASGSGAGNNTTPNTTRQVGVVFSPSVRKGIILAREYLTNGKELEETAVASSGEAVSAVASILQAENEFFAAHKSVVMDKEFPRLEKVKIDSPRRKLTCPSNTVGVSSVFNKILHDLTETENDVDHI